jgi:membrane fusion protein, multidrug efflux system
MNMSRYSILMIATLSLIGALACSEPMERDNAPIAIKTQRVGLIEGSQGFSYSGTIEASESAPLSFNVAGTVADVKVSEGDFVRKGQLLASLNDVTLKNVYEMSQATLDKAEDAYKRLKPMYDKGNLAEIKFVEVETGLQQARAAAAIAKKNLDDCNLHASVDGFVGSRSIEPGMNVLPGITAIKLVNIEKVCARVSISESEISSIEKSQKAKIFVGALGRAEFEGVVEEIGVIADPIAHTYKIKINITNNENRIKPGMICEVYIPRPGPINAILVPNQAVQVDEKGRTFVFTVNETRNKAERKNVETGRLVNEGIEIISGLREGELVVVAGQQKLVNDSPVRIAN